MSEQSDFVMNESINVRIGHIGEEIRVIWIRSLPEVYRAIFTCNSLL